MLQNTETRKVTAKEYSYAEKFTDIIQKLTPEEQKMFFYMMQGAIVANKLPCMQEPVKKAAG